MRRFFALLTEEASESRDLGHLFELVQDAADASLLVFGAATTTELAALSGKLARKFAVLMNDQAAEGTEWLAHRVGPPRNQSELSLAKVEKNSFQLRL